MTKEDLIRKIYLKLSDETDIAVVLDESDFVDIATQVLYDYVLLPEAYIIQ